MRRKVKAVEILLDENGKLSSTRCAAAYVLVGIITPLCYLSLFVNLNAHASGLMSTVLVVLASLVAACLGVGQYSKAKILEPKREKPRVKDQ